MTRDELVRELERLYVATENPALFAGSLISYAAHVVKAEREALTALLDNVGLGYTKHLAECKLLRAYQPKVKAPAKKAKAKR